MSVPPSRAQSEVFSASQYGGKVRRPRYLINYFVLPTFIVHVIGLACLWTLWYYLRFTDVFPYHNRVFYCQDIHLMLPNFRPEDFNVYVSYELLYVLAFCLPPLVILLGEVAFWLFSTKPRKTIYASFGECKVHLFTRRLFRFISVFLFGALITQIFVDSIKLLTGYQRPYFLSLCNVNMAACTAPLQYSPSPSPHLACNYKGASELRYAWLSFPSLHAAFSSYSAIFASCYIYYMINLRGAPLLRPFLIFGFLGLTLVDAFSRINGYKNHWRDIWVGWLIGFVIAFFLCHCVLCFQEVYHYVVERPPVAVTQGEGGGVVAPEERVSPFFSWFRLPRVQAPSVKEEYVVYEEDVPHVSTAPNGAPSRHRKGHDRTCEITTVTESYHRTIIPPGQQREREREHSQANMSAYGAY
ncbi:Phosphatidic acid phosphatase type 2/haloperoxidase domain-containing protein [Strongyloides ratti]|uniref:Phosphatidic acid phosphatase type 2/haloperoxidase domain-containing protein n=1 Tax=Strongyloides ratti TaxID=34506 RepID=A0A090KWG3_STRRB|nr:Phosphatidic acid phosphatase type 2/haloperoxidase domain-containing protein [Strongyloides ratti]CEF59602.1 Phosphatidic acid phosphatase type 2/haloperoxidase domain-containing protein [Strongyloides ratti]